MLNSYSVLADEVAVTTAEPVVTTEVVAQTPDVVIAIEEKVVTSVDEKGSKSIDLSTTSEPTTSTTTTSDTTTSSTENTTEVVNDKPTTGVNNDNYGGTHNYSYAGPKLYENIDQISQITESETPTTSQITSTTEIAKQYDVILETTGEPSVGTLTPLGVADESKPVGLLEYLHRLPNTSSKVMKLSVLSGTFVISGLIIGLLYKFSRKIFG